MTDAREARALAFIRSPVGRLARELGRWRRESERLYDAGWSDSLVGETIESCAEIVRDILRGSASGARLFHLARPDGGTWDDYLEGVVVAPSETEARLMHPDGESVWVEEKPDDWWDDEQDDWPPAWVNGAIGTPLRRRDWPAPAAVIVTDLGTPTDPTTRVVSSSFLRG